MPYLDDSLVVFTDLDGSLLDHDSYSWQPAQGWLDKLAQHGVPVIITTSKTSAEVSSFQRDLQLSHLPFIAENGAYIHLPDSEGPQHQVIGADYQRVREILVQLRQRYDFEFRGFGDVSPQQVADWTGLSLDDARLAMQREGSEPLMWFGSQPDFVHMEKLLAEEGLALTRGGRFWHVMGREAGKGQAVKWLIEHYRQQRNNPPVSLGLGDGPNDISMLEAVDFAVVIRGNMTKKCRSIRRKIIFIAPLCMVRKAGDKGWITFYPFNFNILIIYGSVFYERFLSGWHHYQFPQSDQS